MVLLFPQSKATKFTSLRKANEDLKKREILFGGFTVDELTKEEAGKRTKTSQGEYDATNKLDVVIKGLY